MLSRLGVFFFFWLCWVFNDACGLSLVVVSQAYSLVVVSQAYSLVAMHRLLIAMTSLVEKHRLQGTQASVVAAHRLQSMRSVVVIYRPSCPMVCGSLPDQGQNPCSLHWHVDFKPLDHQGSPRLGILNEFLHLQHFQITMGLLRQALS